MGQSDLSIGYAAFKRNTWLPFWQCEIFNLGNVKLIVSFPDITQVRFSQFILTLLSAHFNGILSNNLHALLPSMWSSFSCSEKKIVKSSVLFGWHLSSELTWDQNQLLLSPLRQDFMEGKFSEQSIEAINFLILF